MRFCICNETYENWEYERALDHIAASGYDAVEIAPFTFSDDPSKLSEQEMAKAGEAARRVGLEVAGLHWLMLKPEGLHLTTADASVRDRTVDFARHLARLCAAMGGKVMVWGSPAQRSIASGQSYEDGFAHAVDCLQKICETAGEVGVTVAMEPLAPKLTNFLTTAEEAVRLIDAVDHPACRLHLDVYAMSTEDKPIPDIIRANRQRLAHFHANDPNLRGPGFGDVDYVPILKTLREIDYQDFVSVEVFDYAPDPETIARDSIGYLRRCLGEADGSAVA